MHLNPFLNAAIAAAYIWGVVLLMQFISSFRANTPDRFLDPIGALSLLVFSVVLMGYLFFYRPIVLMLENKKEEAASFFLKTLGTFGAIALIVIIAITLLYR